MVRNWPANSAVAAWSNWVSAPDAYPAAIAASPADVAAAPVSAAAVASVAQNSVSVVTVEQVAASSPSVGATFPSCVAVAADFAAPSVAYPLTTSGTSPFAWRVSAPAYTPLASCVAPDAASRVPDGELVEPRTELVRARGEPGCARAELPGAVGEGGRAIRGLRGAIRELMCAGGGLAELVAEAREAEEDVLEVDLRELGSHDGGGGGGHLRCDRVVDDLRVRGSGHFDERLLGRPAGAVEVAAAEKFSGIVTTAW